MSTFLEYLETVDFLHNYWQKKPLLIRQAFPDLKIDISANELAGLSLEDDVTSRIVLEKDGAAPWECQHGPFTEATYESMPDSHWTLLVQDVEKHLPELSSLLDYFRFIPRWRIDDLMISYAVDQGSVGPHIDQYDVFLLQASGKRHWHIQQDNLLVDELLEGAELQILKTFEAEQDWVVEPGDVLYLPVGVAHHGIAVGECITCSVGFRAPSKGELVETYASPLASQADNQVRYTDPVPDASLRPGELDQGTLARFQDMVTQSLNNDELLKHAIASHLTEPSAISANFDITYHDFDDFLQQLTEASVLHIHPAIRMLYIKDKTQFDWYIDGERIETDLNASDNVMQLCDYYRIDSKDLLTSEREFMKALYQLYMQGGIRIEY